MTASLPHLAVSTCLLREHDVLLVERAKAPFAGTFSLPGGRVEFGETLTEAARREVQEETGLTIDTPLFQRLHESIGPGFHAVIAVHRADFPSGAHPVAGDDAARVLFVAVVDLPRMEAEGRTTPGLAEIVRSIAQSSRP